MTASALLECSGVEIKITAEIRPGHAPRGFDPGAAPEILRIEAHRIGNGQRVPVPVEAIEQVIGDEAWQAVEERLYSAAEWDCDERDPDAERDAREDR